MAGRPKRRTDVATIEAQGIDAVCALVAEGKSIRDIADQFGVSKDVVWRFVNRADNSAAYDMAQRQKAHMLAEEVVTLADDAKPDEHQITKLKMDGRKWLASKLDRDRFGDAPMMSVNISLTDAHLDALRTIEG